MADLDPAITATIDVLPSGVHEPRTAQIEMTSAQIGVLRDFLDTLDIPDIAANPGYHGMDNDEAQEYAAVLGQLRTVLSKAYPY
jgi:hypothetical protein